MFLAIPLNETQLLNQVITISPKEFKNKKVAIEILHLQVITTNIQS